MKKLIQDSADRYFLVHFAFAGLVVGLAFSSVDLNKVSERVTTAVSVVSLVHASSMRAVKVREGQDDDDAV